MKEKLPNQGTGHSELYEQVIQETTAEFKKVLVGREPIVLSEAQYSAGVDALPKDLEKLAQEVSQRVGDKMDYELSYNQLCKAFFTAAQELGILSVKQ